MPSPGEAATPTAPAPAPTAQPRPFHLAVPVRDVAEARAFYGGALGLREGRSAATWVDFDFFGSQLVAHCVAGHRAATSQSAVDGDAVPVPHFGACLTVGEFGELAARLRGLAAAGPISELGSDFKVKFEFKFEIEPHLRFVGQPGEQWTMFFRDPSGNALEFKAMTRPENLFAKYVVEA